MSKVSIIIPAYNAACFIENALNSVSNQTFKDYEVIVIDDGSTDSSACIINNYIRNQHDNLLSTMIRFEIRYIRQKNAGPSAARNRGIREANGEYIAFLDSDDTWVPDKLAKQAKLLEDGHGIGLVTCGRNVIDVSGNHTISIPRIPTDRKKMLNSFTLGNTAGSCSCVMIRKSCIGTVGYFDESLKVGEDWDMWLRIASVVDIASIDEPLVNYHVRPGSQSGSGALNLENELRLLKKVFAHATSNEIKKTRNKAYSYRYYKAAIAYKENMDINSAKNAIIQSLKIYPLHIFNKAILLFTLKSLLTKEEIHEQR